MNERVSYWLVPAEPDELQFLEIICDLAGWFLEAPIFDPHVTLYSGPLDPRDNVEAIVTGATAGISEVMLRTNGIGHSGEFTKSLFVKFEPSEAVSRISDQLKGRSALPADYRLEPHLSLIYARIPDEMKEQLAREVVIPPMVRFDAVRAVGAGLQTESKTDVEAWHPILKRCLHSA